MILGGEGGDFDGFTSSEFVVGGGGGGKRGRHLLTGGRSAKRNGNERLHTKLLTCKLFLAREI